MLEIFAIYDSAGQFYHPPAFVLNKGIALRDFVDCCNTKDHFLAKHPGDYSLFHFGSFNDITGVYDLLPAPVSLGKAQDFVKRVAQPDPALVKDDVN
ncbi:MAG: DNA binding protein VP5 [Microviridae sp.]